MIRNLTTTDSRLHAPGKLNLADYATWDLLPNQLKDNSCCWNGPSWLSSHSTASNSPVLPTEINYENNNLNETQFFVNQTKANFNILNKFSTYTKLIRVVACVERF